MQEQILYILGAGASAQVLPLAKSIYKNSENEKTILKMGLADELMNITISQIGGTFKKTESSKYTQTLEKIFKHIGEKAKEFGDVDTYAKFLSITNPGNKEFKEVKQSISQYFSIKQLIEGVRDSRYLPWLVNIMENKRFPSNIKILSWNYDFQVQLAASEISELDDINHHQTGFTYLPSFFEYYPNLDPTPDYNNLSLIHLNGIAGFANGSDFKTGSVFQKKFRESNENIIDFISNEKLQQNLHFAWERDFDHKKIMERVENMIKGTTILVVIGYSFPFLNRNIDKQIFHFLQSHSDSLKIYYQDPILDGQQLYSQFNLSKKIDIKHIKSIDNFHIPFEF